jgi:hypothetical protein
MENVFNKITAEKIPDPWKEMVIQIQEAFNTQDKKRTVLRCIIAKTQSVTRKEY